MRSARWSRVSGHVIAKTTRAMSKIPNTMTGFAPLAETSIVPCTSVGGAVAEVVVVPETRRFVMFAEQMTSPPPPLVEPLHWLIVTP